MGVQAASVHASTDIALAVLSAPLEGHYFSLSHRSASRGQVVHALDYVDALPDASDRGQVVNQLTSDSIRQLGVKVRLASGTAGGPIINANNEVVGIAQVWSSNDTSVVWSVDLPSIIEGTPSQLCFGEAVGQSSTICPAGAGPRSTLLARDAAPEVCGAYAADPPFTICASDQTGDPVAAPVTAPGAAALPPAPLIDCWMSTYNSLGAPNVSQLSDTASTLFFQWHITRSPPSGTTGSITVTPPGGAATTLSTTPFVAPGWSSIKVPWDITGPVQDGTWTYNLTLSTGGSCSGTVNALSSP